MPARRTSLLTVLAGEADPGAQAASGLRVGGDGGDDGQAKPVLYGGVDTSLIQLLTLLVAVLAGLGVLSVVLMATRERVHDLGVYKAVGMTPRQTHRHGHLLGHPPAIVAALIARDPLSGQGISAQASLPPSRGSCGQMDRGKILCQGKPQSSTACGTTS